MARKKKAGRQSRLTTVRKGRVLEYLRDGNNYRVSALMGGISERSFSRYLALGRDECDAAVKALNDSGATQQEIAGTVPPEDSYWQFWLDVQKAEAVWESDEIKAIRDAGEEPKFWTARAWMLERRKPRDYGRNLDVTSAGEKIVAEIVFVESDETVQIGDED